MSTSVPITTSAVTVTDNGSTVAVSVASSAVSVDVGTTGPQGATGPGVAVGGTTGQYLRKDSATDYDTSWDTIGTGDVDGLDSALAGKVDSTLFDAFHDMSSTVIDVLPRRLISLGLAASNGVVRATHFTATKDLTVTQVTMATTGTAAGATPTLIRMGLYTVDSAGALTAEIASTPNDTALFAALNTTYTKAFSASASLTKGTRYALAVIIMTSATAPALASSASGFAAVNGLGPRPYSGSGSQTDLPTSFPKTLGTSGFGFWARLS